jgi:hypothetical protein
MNLKPSCDNDRFAGISCAATPALGSTVHHHQDHDHHERSTRFTHTLRQPHSPQL